MQMIMRDILRTLGVGDVFLAGNGEEAYRQYCNSNPDMIITDWQMPEMDGIDFIKKVRTHPDSPNRTIPIIMMTGYTSAGHVRQIMDSGATEFIAKPFTSKDLAKRVGHMVKNPRDFIISPDFVGPSRRRRKSDNFKGECRRKKDSTIIPAQRELEGKAGFGEIDAQAVLQSQKIIDNNKIDFLPIATRFLEELEEALALAKAEKPDDRTKKSVERIYNPIMQLKANGIIFKYNLLGNLARIALEFLDKVNDLDDFVIMIIEAHAKTLRHLIERKTQGDGGEVGEAFEEELSKACDRYMAIRSQLLKKKLETVVREKSAK